jgi:hypothetical protein
MELGEKELEFSMEQGGCRRLAKDRFMWNRQFSTNRWLWAAFTIVLFTAVGSLAKIYFGKSFVTYWNAWYQLLRGEVVSTPEQILKVILYLLFWGTVYGLPCAFVAWVMQAVIVVAISISRGKIRSNKTATIQTR